MSFVQVRLVGDSTPTDKMEGGTTLSRNWADIEGVLSGEWEIGGSAVPTDSIHGLVVDK